MNETRLSVEVKSTIAENLHFQIDLKRRYDRGIGQERGAKTITTTNDEQRCGWVIVLTHFINEFNTKLFFFSTIQKCFQLLFC